MYYDYSTFYYQFILFCILAISLAVPSFIVTSRKVKTNKKSCKQLPEPQGGVINKKSRQKKLPEPQGALPIIGHLHLLVGGKTTIARTLGTMADEYGPIYAVRLGPKRAIVLSSWEMVKECLVNNDAFTATRPNLAFSKYFAYEYACFAFSPYGKYWRDIRKISTVELLSTRRLEKMKGHIASDVSSFMKYLFKESGKIMSLCKWLEYNSFNIIIRLIVGKTYLPKSYEEEGTFASCFKRLISDATYVAGVAVPSDFIPCIEWMDIMGFISSLKSYHKEIDVIMGHWLDEHIQRRKGCQVSKSASEQQSCNYEDADFMDVMLSNVGEGTVMCGYTRETVIKATSLILLLAGSESTSITLTWAVSLLLNHPKALKKAQEELNRQIGKQRWVGESDISNLPYLQAIVKETLRMYPPAPLGGPREALEDCHIDGHLVPKGTHVIVDIWKVHRDRRVWVEPNEFRPERFLGIDFRGQSFEYIPFSLGRRACPGMHFGLHVVHLSLARLVQGFYIRTEDGGPVDMSEGLGLAMPKASPLKVVLEARLPVELYDTL